MRRSGERKVLVLVAVDIFGVGAVLVVGGGVALVWEVTVADKLGAQRPGFATRVAAPMSRLERRGSIDGLGMLARSR